MKDRKKKKPQAKNIMSASATQGGHNLSQYIRIRGVDRSKTWGEQQVKSVGRMDVGRVTGLEYRKRKLVGISSQSAGGLHLEISVGK